MACIRVILVENDPTTVESQAFAFGKLASLGDPLSVEFQPILGNMSETPSVLKRVEEIASEFRPHVALVDLGLLGGPEEDSRFIPLDLKDPSDAERIAAGIEICKYLQDAGTRTIAFSGLLELELAEYLTRNDIGVWEVKGRHFESSTLPKVYEQAKKVCAAARQFSVSWPLAGVPEALAKHQRFSDTNALRETHFADLLCQLFHQEQSINLFGLGVRPISRAGDVIRRAPVFRVETHQGIMGIVKFAPKDQVYEEYLKYRNFIENRITVGSYPNYSRPVHFWEVGAIFAGYVGSGGRPFPDFMQHYQDAGVGVPAVVEPLQHFFESVWKVHYEGMEKIQAGEFYDSYVRCYPKFEKRVALFSNAEAKPLDRQKYSFLSEALPDPVEYVKQNRNQIQISFPKLAVTHGDLHCLNLLVDNNRSFIIDFEFTGKGPRLRDFARLETDVYIRLVANESKESRRRLFELSSLLMSQKTRTHVPDASDYILADPALTRAYSVLSWLRLSMMRATNYGDMNEYFWTLLLEIVYRAGRAKERQSLEPGAVQSIKGAVSDNKVDPDDRLEECLLIGGVIAKRLSQGA